MPLRSASRDTGSTLPQGTDDVRGWKVRSGTDDHEVGNVHEILLDESGRPRYLEVQLDEGGEHVLLPAGHARSHTDDQVVRVHGVSRKGFSSIPAYDQEATTITPEYERSVVGAYDAAYTGTGFYERPEYRAQGWSQGRQRDVTGRLARLDTLDDFEVADGDIDPRGWTVEGADGRELGKVDHLIGDTGAMKVRYLTLDVHRDLADEERHVLIPAGHAHLDRDGKRVHVDALTADRVGTIPAHGGGEIDRDFERRLTESYAGAYTDERRYEHPRYRYEGLRDDRTRL